MKIDTLEPGFREEVCKLLEEAERLTGLKWIVTCGRRTMAEQKKLYDQGRTAPGAIVTNARAGSSPHNFGLAADLAPLSRNNQIWWDAPRSVWQKMADAAVGAGLTSGFYFKSLFDAPHVEAKNWKIAQTAWKNGEIAVA